MLVRYAGATLTANYTVTGSGIEQEIINSDSQVYSILVKGGFTGSAAADNTYTIMQVPCNGTASCLTVMRVDCALVLDTVPIVKHSCQCMHADDVCQLETTGGM